MYRDSHNAAVDALDLACALYGQRRTCSGDQAPGEMRATEGFVRVEATGERDEEHKEISAPNACSLVSSRLAALGELHEASKHAACCSPVKRFFGRREVKPDEKSSAAPPHSFLEETLQANATT